jgi:hypothetical protein
MGDGQSANVIDIETSIGINDEIDGSKSACGEE